MFGEDPFCLWSIIFLFIIEYFWKLCSNIPKNLKLKTGTFGTGLLFLFLLLLLECLQKMYPIVSFG